MTLLKEGLHPHASDALRRIGVSSERIVQTIGNAGPSAGVHIREMGEGAPARLVDGKPYCAAVDLRTRDLTTGQIKTLLTRMGAEGFAAWYRQPGHDGWPDNLSPHIHAVWAGTKMKPALQTQVRDFLQGRNGLISHRTYTFLPPTQAIKEVVRANFLTRNPEFADLLREGDAGDESSLPDLETEVCAHQHLEDGGNGPVDALTQNLPEDPDSDTFQATPELPEENASDAETFTFTRESFAQSVAALMEQAEESRAALSVQGRSLTPDEEQFLNDLNAFLSHLTAARAALLPQGAESPPGSTTAPETLAPLQSLMMPGMGDATGAPALALAPPDSPPEAADTTGDQWCFAWYAGPHDTDGSNRAALLRRAMWPRGSIITISFLDGDPALQNRVKEAALRWTRSRGGPANLTFAFRNNNHTNIRISFRYSGSWSVIGTTCLQNKDITSPTMNYGWLKPNSSQAEVDRVVLHEFGHALGLIHEHQNPAGGIPWNKPVVTQELSGPPNNWDAATIDFNMFKAFGVNETNFTQTDAKSIMMYPIPARWTNGQFVAGLNSGLSPQDVAFIRAMYP